MKLRIPFHSNSVWPPAVLVVLFAVLYAMVTGCIWLIKLAVPVGAITEMDLAQVLAIRTGILAGSAGVYAVYRLGRFHPVCNPAYSAWLGMSPWTADKPLPLGPVQLVWEDVVVIAALAAIAQWHAHTNPCLVLIVFGLAYLIGMTVMLALTRRAVACLLLGFLWPTLILPGLGTAATIAIVVAIVVVIWRGHRNSLRAFPLGFPTGQSSGSLLQKEVRIDLVYRTPARTLVNVGWPFAALSPKLECHSISIPASLCLSAQIGWWSFCLLKRFGVEPLPELIPLFTAIAAMIRLAIYCVGVRPPFNLWGRIASGRLILPAFDKVFVTPMAAMLLSVIGVILIKYAGAYHPLVETCVIGVLWFVLLGGGPTLRNWILTGQHRFRPLVRVKAGR